MLEAELLRARTPVEREQLQQLQSVRFLYASPSVRCRRVAAAVAVSALPCIASSDALPRLPLPLLWR